MVGLIFCHDELREEWTARVEEHGFDPSNELSVAQYLGKKVRADWLETNQLMVDFVWLSTLEARLGLGGTD